MAYASRSMTETGSHYAQIEMLAIVFTVERFEQFVYGHPAQVKTDHKLLESIFEKSLVKRLQKFDLLVTYKKGSEMVLVTFLVEHLMSEL